MFERKRAKSAREKNEKIEMLMFMLWIDTWFCAIVFLGILICERVTLRDLELDI